MDIKREICKILLENGVSEESINDNTLLKDVGINSLSFIKIVVEIESRFDISFSEEKLILEQFSDFLSLSNYVCELIGK